MKRIEAIVRPESMEAVKQALLGIGLAGLHAENVIGHGHQGGITRSGRGGQPYVVDMIAKVKITAVLPDDRCEEALEVVISHARTGRIGDGKIFISDVGDALRVRTRESGEDVL